MDFVMPSTTNSPYSNSYQAVVGLGYDGVVQIRVDNYYGTGILLSDGYSVLTGAHLFANTNNILFDTQVIFETLTQNKTVSSIGFVTIHPEYSTTTSGADLAIIHLKQPAFLDADRYSIYRNDDIVSKNFTMVGYGIPGTDTQGVETNASVPVRRMADNTIDGDVSLLNEYLGNSLSWTPPNGTQFIADFDNGNSINDAAGQLFNKVHIGVGSQEGIISTGDKYLSKNNPNLILNN